MYVTHLCYTFYVTHICIIDKIFKDFITNDAKINKKQNFMFNIINKGT